MIPIYRNSLTRTDLSLVLNYMVENELEGNASGIQLAKDMSTTLRCHNAIALRSPIDAMLLALESLECDTVLVPILLPHVFTMRLEAFGKKLVYYDVDIETMAPVFHRDYPIEYSNNMARIDFRFLGGIVEPVEPLPEEFSSLPTIEVCWSIKKSLVSESNKDIEKSNENADFIIVLMEQNTVLTSAGGAVLAASSRNNWRKLSKATSFFDSWITLTDFNASLALAQLKQSGEFLSRIEKSLPLYISAIQQTRHTTLPCILHEQAVPQCFPIYIKKQVSDIVKQIRKQGIECIFPFQHSTMGIMMEQENNEKISLLQKYPHASKYISNIISVPFYPALSNDEVKSVVKAIANIL